MNKELEIPEGYEARIEGNKVILERKESEDERIRKALVKTFEKKLEIGFEWTEFGIPNRSVLDWLEKQKEQKEIKLVNILKHYPKETELYSPLYGKLWLAEVDETNEIITCYKHPLEKDDVRATLEQEDTVSFFSNGTTGLPDFEVSKDCMLFLYNNEKHKEQKPVEWTPTKEQMVALNWAANGIDNESPVAGDIKASLRSLYTDIQSKSIKSAEWSEEYEKKISELKTFIAQCNGFNKANRQKAFNMIDALRPQPKQEQQIKEGIKVKIHCRKDRKKGMITIYDGEVGEVIYVLDAKRHPWGHIVVRLNNGCNDGFYEDELEVLDEPHWKPSEEQMKTLKSLPGLLRDFKLDTSAQMLEVLYEQLKSL